MQITRRSALALVGSSALAAPSLARAQSASAPQPAAPPYTQRSLGSPKAPVTVQEYFSFTCTHCAHFATVTMPQVKKNLIDTGKVQFIYHDFPLDQVALKAAQVARYLPAAQYYPFAEALFASQDDWAFKPNEDYHASIFKYAALAGMDQATFETAWNDDKLAQFILTGQQEAEKMYNISATPTFIINGKPYPGAMEYNDFAATVASAAKG
ncbi:MAG: DsbA family protein [Acidocella sp.]|nr:DsbA family protein [Acidocella sp.]